MYQVLDLETENYNVLKRFANPFSAKNWPVAVGWKVQGETRCSYTYAGTKEEYKGAFIHPKATMLIGHNIKFDLLHIWHEKAFQDFLKRGGKIWDTQLAEYLINGMSQEHHMVAMDDIVEKYGGRLKLDMVKALWEMGKLTSEIDKDMLIDYLVGTEEEGRNSGDIGNTELIFLGQLSDVRTKGMLTMIKTRMESLLSTCMMEANGLYIDIEEAKRRMKILRADLEACTDRLYSYIPQLPEELVFNWNSGNHVSALLYGGTVKYEVVDTYEDTKTGELARKKAFEYWPLFNGVPVSPSECSDLIVDGIYTKDNVTQDLMISGLKKGKPKLKKVEVIGELKTKKQDRYFRFTGYVKPKSEWAGAKVDVHGVPVYKTNKDVIEELAAMYDVPFIKDFALRNTLVKDLGTYYVQYDPKKKDYVGMLTHVDPEDRIVHHTLNHTSTVTGRLSSSNPNLQNIPRAGTSEVKKMFASRFGEKGVMLEIDYSQLEVVVQGLLSLDPNLVKDLNNNVDFHCKRVAKKYGISYADALKFCKDSTSEDHDLWKSRRTKAKEFSFQRAYGAGAFAISLSTGIPVEEIKEMIQIEECEYSGVVDFNKAVEKAVNASAVPFRDHAKEKVYRRGTYIAPTGTTYTFTSQDAPDFLQARGVTESFKPTELKNYAVQGFGGELVQLVLGKLFRLFISNNNYDGKALLCNTVHDCVWVDCHKDVAVQVSNEMCKIMTDIPKYLNELYGLDCPVPFPVEAEIGPNLYDKHVLKD